MGSREYCALDSLVYFGAVYIICLFTSHVSPLILFSSPFPYLSFPLGYRVDPLDFQAVGCKRRPNLGFFGCFSLFYVIVFLCF